MFDLESAIIGWRDGFGRHNVDDQTLAELECHLRDAFGKLHRADVSAEQAWRQAVSELGDPAKLAHEFRKKPAEFVWWPKLFAIGIVVFAVTAVGSLLLSRHQHDWLLVAHVLAITVGYVSLFAIGSLAVCAIVQQAAGYWNAERDSALRSSGRKLASLSLLCVSFGVIGGMLWSGRNRYHYWSWDPREIGGLLALAWAAGTELVLRARASTRVIVGMGLLANVVTVLAWFGPVSLSARHSYGVDEIYGPGIAVVVLLHLVLLAGVLLLPQSRTEVVKAD